MQQLLKEGYQCILFVGSLEVVTESVNDKATLKLLSAWARDEAPKAQAGMADDPGSGRG